MSYYIRLLSPKEEAPAGAEIQDALLAEGFEVAVAAMPADAGWEEVSVQAAGPEPIVVRRHLRQGEENPVDEEVDSFLELLLEEEESPGVEQVEAALRRVSQLIQLEVPEAFPWGTERTVVDALVEFLADRTEALIQADGEGFYDREGNLLVATE